MINKKIILAGGAGFMGQALAARWGKDNRVIILTRGSAGSPNNSYGSKLPKAADGCHIIYRHWDGRTIEPIWTDELEGCDLVVNLSGRSVNCRYNARNKREIFDSRTDPTHAIGQAIAATVVPPKLWVNASSATIYRHATDRPQDEYTGELGKGFSVEVCQKWESAFFGERTPFTRKIAMRTAITFGRGGVIVPYLRLVKAGLGGRQGSGRQMYSWVHIDDVAGTIEWFLDHPEMEGAYNVAAPGPVTNAYFMSLLRREKGVVIGLPAPAWLLRLGALLIGTETELLLKSRWVLPTRLLESGFRFQYSTIEEALKEVIHEL